jgi:hypothetical protein
MCRPQKRKTSAFPILIILVLLFSGAMCHAAEEDDLMADIEKLISVAPASTPSELSEAIANRIRSNPSLATKVLLPKLRDLRLSEQELSVYVWAVGLARDPGTVDAVIELASLTRSDLVLRHCYEALAAVGDEKSGQYLLTELDKNTRLDIRSELIDLLCQMQYEAVLPRMEEILKKDFKENYWESVFAFGKMGDKAVPFLLGKIEDPDRNIRMNSIHVLGQWLIAPEAAQPFRECYWKEQDAEIRSLVLSSLERITPDFKTMAAFSEEVVKKEKDETPLQFARETVGNLEKMKAKLDSFAKEKTASPADFARQYDQLYISAGKTGDYQALSAASSPDDEPKLKKLRRRILQRNSDEAFEDYQKVNRIIMWNRMLKVREQ